jgi:hypothetical protein
MGNASAKKRFIRNRSKYQSVDFTKPTLNVDTSTLANTSKQWIPPEILTHIFGYCSFEDITQFARFMILCFLLNSFVESASYGTQSLGTFVRLSNI